MLIGACVHGTACLSYRIHLISISCCLSRLVYRPCAATTIPAQSVVSSPVEEIDPIPCGDEEDSVGSLYTTTSEGHNSQYDKDDGKIVMTVLPTTPAMKCSKSRHKTPYPSKGFLYDNGALELSPTDAEPAGVPTALLVPTPSSGPSTDSTSPESFFDELLLLTPNSMGLVAKSADDLEPRVSPVDFFVRDSNDENTPPVKRIKSSSTLRKSVNKKHFTEYVDSPVPGAILHPPRRFVAFADNAEMTQASTPTISNVKATPQPSSWDNEPVYYSALESSPDSVEL